MVILGSIGPAGCQTATPSTGDQAKEGRVRITSKNLDRIADREWVLQEMILDAKKQDLVPGSRVTLVIKPDGSVGGMGSINHYGGNLQINETGEIQWSDRGFITTKMAGSPELMAQETRFLSSLPETDRVFLEKSSLVLTDPDGKIKLRFVAKPREVD